MGKTAAIIGASGLIGNHLLTLLLRDNYYAAINAIVRKPLQITHAKLHQLIIDFSDIEALENAIAEAEVVFCAIGTTNSKVNGDKEAYKKVDFDIPVNAAKAAAKSGASNFVLVSAIGANALSSNFYLQLKGAVEEKISKEAIPKICFMQPSLLMGKRTETRLGEGIGQIILPLFAPLMMGGLAKYKPIKAEDVARAMMNASKEDSKGIFKYTFPEMKSLIAS